MKRFVEGVDRGQSTLFPERLADWIRDDNPMRVTDVFVDRGLAGGEFLQRPFVPEPLHRSFSSSERLVGILGAIVEPPTTLLIGSIADYLHR